MGTLLSEELFIQYSVYLNLPAFRHETHKF
jgi:hypothetical protein